MKPTTRHPHNARARLLRGALVLATLPAGHALAALGGDTSTLESERAALGGQMTREAAAHCTVHVLKTTYGETVREYADAQGRIFAVSWRGPTDPGLNWLLGTHYPDFARALAHLERPGLRRSLRVVTPTLVVESHAELRAHDGAAYLPALLPAGVDAAALP